MKSLLTMVRTLLFTAIFWGGAADVAWAATGATDWSKKLPFELKSRYFEFHYQRQGWNAVEFAKFADAFVDLVNRDFVKVDFDYPIQVLVFPTQETFQQFLQREWQVSDPPDFGIYFRAFKVFATYEDSGLGTFAHEIMHPLVDRNLRDCPVWATEAIPAFFEKFYGYWDDERLVVQWGYQNPWRIRTIGSRLRSLDLKRIVADRRGVTDLNNSERRLVTVFLWQHGRFERFLKLIAERKHPGFRSYFEAAMERPLKDILPLWQAYLNEIESNRVEVMMLPSSMVLQNRAQFDVMNAQERPWLQPKLGP